MKLLNSPPKYFKSLFIFLAVIFITGCATVYNPATERREAVFITTEQEVNIGRQVEREVLQSFKLSNDPAYIRRTILIGNKLAAVSDRQDLIYKFGVVESKDINAFALPGGSVYVTTGLLKAVASDDELAAVIGHEVGHISARHPVKRLESQMGYSFLVTLAYMLDTRSADVKNRLWEDIRLATDTTFKLIALGYSRRDEMLADSLGVVYSGRSGYDPRAAVTFLKKLAEEERGTPEWLIFLRSHPYAKERVAALEEWLSVSRE